MEKQGFFQGDSESEQQTQRKHQDHVIKQMKKIPPLPLISDQHSLEPDMINGWKPKIQISGPIPLYFKCFYSDYIINQILSNTMSPYWISYLGKRPINTVKHMLTMVQNQQFDWKYKQKYKINWGEMKHAINSIGIQNAREHFQENNPKNYQKDPLFNSNFQGGNLDVAIKVSSVEYDLFIRNDSNTKGHAHWYYFSVRNVPKNKRIRFNIVNYRKSRCLYYRGMKPYIFSKLSSKQWQQGGQNVKFFQKLSRYNYDIKLSSLQFNYTFQSQNDQVFFAYCIPYTYTTLTKFIKTHCQNPNLHVESLCQTITSVNIPLLTITAKQESQNKKVVLVTARIHPGESNSSYVLQGFVNALLENTQEAESLRNHYVFKIVPMMNPDGVIFGNYRTGIQGRDLNRAFKNPNPIMYPNVAHLNKLAGDLKKKYQKRFQYFIDLHGHSVKRNVFLYGPELGGNQLNYIKARQFARNLQAIEPMFRYSSSIFSIHPAKQSTARAIFFNNLKIPFAFTIQTSNCGYFKDNQLFRFKVKDLLKIGQSLVKGIFKHNDQKRDCQGVLVESNKCFKGGNKFNRGRKSSQEMHRKNLKRRKKVNISVQNIWGEENNFSQGGSDSEPDFEDFSKEEHEQLRKAIIATKQKYRQIICSMNKIKYKTKQTAKRGQSLSKFERSQQPNQKQKPTRTSGGKMTNILPTLRCALRQINAHGEGSITRPSDKNNKSYRNIR